MSTPRSVLICHAGDRFDREGLAAWLDSFTTLAGIVVLEETRAQVIARLRREIKRVGWLRITDVLAMRVYQQLVLARANRRWLESALQTMESEYGGAPHVPVLVASDVNDERVLEFLQAQRPDMVIARCKQLLKRKALSLAPLGTFVMHPGICPEYRNAHGCFWALAERDLNRVGMTLLKIDAGVDTGPVFGRYSYPFDEKRESHVVIQYRVVSENLESLRDKLLEIAHGYAVPETSEGRSSAVWGQPWLTRYLRWRMAARRVAS
ncbi:methionyl-tRNA formyltransferase [Luteibacter sp. Sphag1AF]|uniref:formyltransferase family protein n=1 Tax=Luteibacter sp. Sphag1AF TaxID=2587031 RepID=UPI0016182F28|nr:formyltransferase family protein [Luteibacter sp. Sphag1AF]MBB3228574.1 methionyl-tRNA formyltransferase [Luteibacter sp. Sphag1AF]